MRTDRVFTAPSLSEIIRQLMIYRPSGLLTIQRMTGLRQAEANITIERGRPTHILWDRQEEKANESNLAWLNTWGEIRFTFQSVEPLLQLPPASSSSQESPGAQEHTTKPPSSPQQPRHSTTRPLPAVAKTNLNGSRLTGPLRPIPMNDTKDAKSEYTASTTPQNDVAAQFAESLPLIAPEKVLPSVTAAGKAYPIANIPRYDRVVFLLINGQRTLADLVPLTKRSIIELYTSLYRLQEQQLITIEMQTTNGQESTY